MKRSALARQLENTCANVEFLRLKKKEMLKSKQWYDTSKETMLQGWERE